MYSDQKILLTPGPLTTSMFVKQAMLTDLGTRDQDYQELIQQIRLQLLNLAQADKERFCTVLLQGSGTYGIESVLTSVIRPLQKVLILENGAYGKRMQTICEKAGIPYEIKSYSMIASLPLAEIEKEVQRSDITHVAFIHCETTAGVMNDLPAIMRIIHKYHKISIVDAMSSFGSMPISLDDTDIDYLITSSNKCLHGVPGIAVIFAKKSSLETCSGISHSLSLDLYDQYKVMEEQSGSFRFTSPTHVLLALNAAIQELQQSGGIPARHAHYVQLQEMIQNKMQELGFQTLVRKEEQSPIITTYLIPPGFDFSDFYAYMKRCGFLLYSGKLPNYNAFRIGNIGHITSTDIQTMLSYAEMYCKEKRL